MSHARFRTLIRRVNLYPPFLAMGIRVKAVNEDFTRFEVRLKSAWYNRNLFGTHFGGSLYAMCDPFYVFIITLNLGPDYIVWDKSAAIRFLSPARGTITGVFEIAPARLEEIRRETDLLGRQTFHFEADLREVDGNPVARVEKEVYVRRKPGAVPSGPGA